MQRLPGSVALGMSAMGDPEDSTASSGWPTSVLRALREVVGRVVAVSDTPAGGWYHGSMAAGAVCGALALVAVYIWTYLLLKDARLGSARAMSMAFLERNRFAGSTGLPPFYRKLPPMGRDSPKGIVLLLLLSVRNDPWCGHRRCLAWFTSSCFGVRLSLLILVAAVAVFLWCYPRMANLEAPWDCALGCWV